MKDLVGVLFEGVLIYGGNGVCMLIVRCINCVSDGFDIVLLVISVCRLVLVSCVKLSVGSGLLVFGV